MGGFFTSALYPRGRLNSAARIISHTLLGVFVGDDLDGTLYGREAIPADMRLNLCQYIGHENR